MKDYKGVRQRPVLGISATLRERLVSAQRTAMAALAEQLTNAVIDECSRERQWASLRLWQVEGRIQLLLIDLAHRNS